MFQIRKILISDIPQLIAIEHSANQAFAQIPQLKWLAESAVISSDQHLDLIQNHDAFVAIYKRFHDIFYSCLHSLRYYHL